RPPGTVLGGVRRRVGAEGAGPPLAEVMAWRRGRVATEDLRRLVAAEALCADLRDWARGTLAER
ncbi:MAG: hypothetical protein ACO4BW_05110, partial [Nitriliruptoraceae bacterium]